jgi:CRISPR/Cas system-associated exonuclease Cas4 (RecB family)
MDAGTISNDHRNNPSTHHRQLVGHRGRRQNETWKETNTVTNNTRDMLYKNMQGIRETIEEFARQIKSGEFMSTWAIQLSDDEEQTFTYRATSEDDAYQAYVENHAFHVAQENVNIYVIESADEPTTEDTPISEYPLEVVDERGREYAVVLCTGGPHIEVVADGLCDARLVGYWSGETVTMSGNMFSTFLDYFIERD